YEEPLVRKPRDSPTTNTHYQQLYTTLKNTSNKTNYQSNRTIKTSSVQTQRKILKSKRVTNLVK
ncbi:MAG: hypothetical protein VX186_00675, partial [Nitrospinota bacterium]|nr:hypothetical protein [Nitrospinota bacterium]